MQTSRAFAELRRLLQVSRERLEKHDLHMEVYRESDGWRWDIREKPIFTRRVFPTLRATLEHADVYTKLWHERRSHFYGEPMESEQDDGG